MTLHVAIDG